MHPTVLDKIPIASVGEDCINFFKIGGGGGGLVRQLDPSYTSPPPPPPKKKNSSRIIPRISGKTPASHTLNIGAFVTKRENSRKYQHQSASNGIRVHHLHPFFQKKKNNNNNNNQGRPPSPLQEEKILSLFFLKDENTLA